MQSSSCTTVSLLLEASCQWGVDSYLVQFCQFCRGDSHIWGHESLIGKREVLKRKADISELIQATTLIRCSILISALWKREQMENGEKLSHDLIQQLDNIYRHFPAWLINLPALKYSHILTWRSQGKDVMGSIWGNVWFCSFCLLRIVEIEGS